MKKQVALMLCNVPKVVKASKYNPGDRNIGETGNYTPEQV